MVETVDPIKNIPRICRFGYLDFVSGRPGEYKREEMKSKENILLNRCQKEECKKLHVMMV